MRFKWFRDSHVAKLIQQRVSSGREILPGGLKWKWVFQGASAINKSITEVWECKYKEDSIFEMYMHQKVSPWI